MNGHSRHPQKVFAYERNMVRTFFYVFGPEVFDLSRTKVFEDKILTNRKRLPKV